MSIPYSWLACLSSCCCVFFCFSIRNTCEMTKGRKREPLNTLFPEKMARWVFGRPLGRKAASEYLRGKKCPFKILSSTFWDLYIVGVKCLIQLGSTSDLFGFCRQYCAWGLILIVILKNNSCCVLVDCLVWLPSPYFFLIFMVSINWFTFPISGRASSIYSILLLLLRDSSNFKIRIQAAAALAVPPTVIGE